MRNCVAAPAASVTSLNHGEWTLTLVQDCALASVSSRVERTTALKEALSQQGFEMPFVESFTGDAERGAFWVGPHQYMLWQPYQANPDWAGQLALGEGVFTTEQTDGWARVDLAGPNLAAVFERLVNLDARRWVPGFATRSVLHHIGCFVVVREDGFSILVPRSMADSAIHAIEQSMQTVLALN